MKRYNVEFTPAAEKLFQKLDRTVKFRIRNWINKNLVGCSNPRFKGKALTGNLTGRWRYRVGNYRIVADIQDDKILILIVDIDKRNDVYK